MSVRAGLRRISKLQAQGADPFAMTEQDWVQAMKRHPIAVHEMPGGFRLLQWSSGRYEVQRVAVLFNAQHRYHKIQSRYQC